MELILASSSPYRRKLLERLGLPFRALSPEVNESRLPGEAPAAMATRLATSKARAISNLYPRALVIGSDQVAALEDRIIGKPGDHANARAQLQACSGRALHFFTGISLCCAERDILMHHVEPYSVRFRPLDEALIDRYLVRDKPYDCAGSFKVESLGIALFDSMTGADPTSLEGLPLISLTTMLNECRYPPL